MSSDTDGNRDAARAVEISNCPRCGASHETNIQVIVGTSPDPFDYWGTCPVVEQPFYLSREPRGLVLENEIQRE